MNDKDHDDKPLVRIEINDIKRDDIMHVIRVAMSYTNNNLRLGLETAHPDRRDVAWWNRFEDDVHVIKSLRELLDMMEGNAVEGGAE